MQTRLIVAGLVFLLAAASTAVAAEVDSNLAAVADTVASVDIQNVHGVSHVTKDPKLQKWLQGVKPAAGGTNYWQQKVVRRANHKMVRGSSE